MSEVENVSLADDRFFSFISGLWKGKKPPFKSAAVLRSTNFRGDGLFSFEDVAQLDVEERQLDSRQLRRGDIVIERSGGGPKQPVGRVAYFDPPDDMRYATSNFTTALRVVDRHAFDPEYVCFFLHALYLSGATETLQRATTGIRNLDWAEYQSFRIPRMPVRDQEALAAFIKTTQESVLIEERQIVALTDLKRAAMRTLFTRGLRGDAQKETEIGPVPESWCVEPLRTHYSVASGGTPSRSNSAYWRGGTIPWVKTTEVGYRVIDETEEHITQAGLDGSAAKLLPPGALLLAMYGQGVTRGKVAILGIQAACNQACAAMIPTDDTVDAKYLYHFLSYRYEEIRQLAHGGQQQNLNLDIVRELLIAFPHDKVEQQEIVTVLDAIDRKVDLHRRKRAVLDDLFKALLHKLMTGQIRIADLDLSALPVKPAAERAA